MVDCEARALVTQVQILAAPLHQFCDLVVAEAQQACF